MLRILKRLLYRYLNTNTEIKAIMWWYNVNKRDAEKYLKYLSQSVINIIVKYFKNYENENLQGNL